MRRDSRLDLERACELLPSFTASSCLFAHTQQAHTPLRNPPPFYADTKCHPYSTAHISHLQSRQHQHPPPGIPMCISYLQIKTPQRRTLKEEVVPTSFTQPRTSRVCTPPSIFSERRAQRQEHRDRNDRSLLLSSRATFYFVFVSLRLERPANFCCSFSEVVGGRTCIRIYLK